MAITYKALVNSKEMEAANTIQYTAPAESRAIIDKMTATNTSGLAAVVSVWLVPTGIALGNSNLIVDAKSIDVGETYSFPEMPGQTLEALGILYTGGTASALTIRVNGRVIT